MNRRSWYCKLVDKIDGHPAFVAARHLDRRALCASGANWDQVGAAERKAGVWPSGRVVECRCKLRGVELRLVVDRFTCAHQVALVQQLAFNLLGFALGVRSPHDLSFAEIDFHFPSTWNDLGDILVGAIYGRLVASLVALPVMYAVL